MDVTSTSKLPQERLQTLPSHPCPYTSFRHTRQGLVPECLRPTTTCTRAALTVEMAAYGIHARGRLC